MATRATYRTRLRNKLRDVADNLGKKDFTDAELDEMLANSPRRLFPHIYKVTAITAKSSDAHGRMSTSSDDARLVFEIWDDDTDAMLTGWVAKGSDTIARLPLSENNLRYYFYGPYTMPSDDGTDAGIPDEFEEMVVLAAALDGIERLGVDRVDFTGYQPGSEVGVDEPEILALHDTFQRSLDLEIQSKGQSLPAWLS